MIYIPVNFEVLRLNYAGRIPNPRNLTTSILEVKDLQNSMDDTSSEEHAVLHPGESCIEPSGPDSTGDQPNCQTAPTPRR